MIVSQLIDRSFDLKPVARLSDIDNYEELFKLIDGFKVSEKTINQTLSPVLNYLSYSDNDEHRPIIIEGPYGAGKTHTLCFIAGILKEKTLLKEWTTQVNNYDLIVDELNSLQKQKYLVVPINCVEVFDLPFSQLFQQAVFQILIENGMYMKTPFSAVADALSKKDNPIRKSFIDAYGKEYSEGVIKSLRYSFDKDLYADFGVKWKDLFDMPIPENWNSFKEFLVEVTELLHKNQYSGAIILLDELSTYVQARSRRSNSIHDDLSALETLAAHSAATWNSIKVIAVSHASGFDETYWDIDEPAVFSKVQKVLKSRFVSIDIEAPGSILSMKTLFRRYPNFDDEIKNIPKAWPFFNAKSLFLIDPIETYPIHPYLVNLIPDITYRFAQSNRTILQFLDWAYMRIKDKDFIDGQKVNQISIFDVYDFFIEDKELLSNQSSVVYAINEVIDSSKNIAFATDISKALITQYLRRTSRGSKPDSSNISDGLSASELSSLLQIPPDIVKNSFDSIKSDFLFFNTDTQKFVFLPASGHGATKLQDVINETASRCDLKNALRLFLGGRIRWHDSSSMYMPLKRDVAISYIFDDELNQLDESQFRLAYILPSKSTYVGETGKPLSNGKRNVIIAEFENWNLSSDILRKFMAVKMLQNDDRFVNDYEKTFLRNKLETYTADLVHSLGLTKHSNNIVYWWNGSRKKGNRDEIIRNVLQTIFYETPDFDLEQIKQERKNLAPVLYHILQIKGILPPKIDQYRLFVGVMKAFDLMTIDGDRYTIKLPSNQDIKGFKAWNYLVDILDGDIDNNLNELFRNLSNPPFGLTIAIIELLLAAYVVLKRGSIMRIGSPEPIRLDDLVLKEISSYKNKRFIVVNDAVFKNKEKVNRYREIMGGAIDTSVLQTIKDILNNIQGKLSKYNINNKQVSLYLISIESYLSGNKHDAEFIQQIVREKEVIMGLHRLIAESEQVLQGITITLSIEDSSGLHFRKEINIVSDLLKKFEDGFFVEAKLLIKKYVELYDAIFRSFNEEHAELQEFYAKIIKKYQGTNIGEELAMTISPCKYKRVKNFSTGLDYVCQNTKCKYSFGELGQRKREAENFVQVMQDRLSFESEMEDELDKAIKNETKDIPPVYSSKFVLKSMSARFKDLDSLISQRRSWKKKDLIRVISRWISETIDRR